MKYVIFRKEMDTVNVEYPVIFPNYLVHADVAAAMTATGAPLDGFKPVAAGEYNGFACSGESSTLGLKSREEEDAHIIHSADYGGCFR